MPSPSPAPADTPRRAEATDILPQPAADGSRYSRQILFPGIGQEGQDRLAAARVAVVGCGAIGAVTAGLLARSGVGRLSLIDRDFVEPSNLQRQVLYDEADARDAIPKAEAARQKLLAANSSVAIHAHIADLVPGNIADLLGDAHLILDATDNFETRYLINDFAVQQGIPWIYAGAVGSQASTMTVLPLVAPGSRPAPYTPGACLACLFPELPTGVVDTCDTAGILGPAVALAASLQAGEALKLLTGNFPELRRTLFSADLWHPRARGSLQNSEVPAEPRPGCDVCDLRNFRFLAGARRPQITLCGRNSVQIHEHDRPLDLATLETSLRRDPDITGLRRNQLLLRFTRRDHTITVFPDGRALIQGTTDPALARSLYARFIGA